MVIPAHNHAKYVADAIRSAADQGPVVTEIIVVDDGSTDGTAEAARRKDDPRLRLLIQPNRGPSSARNTGWRATQAGWIQFLDADDMLAPGAIMALLAAAESGHRRIPFGIQAVYGEDMTGEPVTTSRLAARGGNLLEEVGVWYHGSILTALTPRWVLEELDGFDESVRYGEDHEFAIRVAQKYEFTYVAQATYFARMHGANKHRLFDSVTCRQHLDFIRRNLGAGKGLAARWRYRKAMANKLWQFGQHALALGERAQARSYFQQAWQFQPLKLGAWRGWLYCCLRRGTRRLGQLDLSNK